MPKVFSIRFTAFLLGFVILVFVVMNSLESTAAETPIEPLGFVPDPQNGYGSGADQLAQPDDVEILKNGNLLISDVDNNRIQYFNAGGDLLRSINAESLGLTTPDIIPTGISSDAAGFIYITLEGVGMVARFNQDLSFDQFIGHPGKVSAEEYYLPENDGLLMKPQGIIVSRDGDVFVIDMAKKVFKKDGKRNFGFRKFKQVHSETGVSYVYDTAFASTQEITRIMRKSEGMAMSEARGLLFIAEEKPHEDQFGNTGRFRYIGVFDLEDGTFKDRLIGVTREAGRIIDGSCDESIEGLAVFGNYLFAVAEKAGRVDCYDIDSGRRLRHFGVRAPFYCDDESDCIIDGVNYNEQSIMAGTAQVHLLNDWRKSELASPDGISAMELTNGQKRLAVVDQWNSRILQYDLAQIVNSFEN